MFAAFFTPYLKCCRFRFVKLWVHGNYDQTNSVEFTFCMNFIFGIALSISLFEDFEKEKIPRVCGYTLWASMACMLFMPTLRQTRTSPRGSVSVCRLGEAGKDPWFLLRDRVSQSWRFSSFSGFRMLRLMLCSTVFLCLIVPAPAPFAKSDPRSIFNFLIEPWWCLVPRIVRCQIMRITC